MRIRRLFTMIVLCLFFCSVSVWAEEEEWIPDNAFYKEHMEECISHNREYLANGPNGEVILYESPLSAEEIYVVENGNKVYIDFVYTNEKNIDWGYCEVEGEKGWVPMPYLTLIYDYLSFAEEYAEQISEERGTMDHSTLFHEGKDVDVIRFWSYPGSNKKYSVVIGNGTHWPIYTQTYVDEQGRKWGFIPYFVGDKTNRWICLDDLDAEFDELYPEGAPERGNDIVTEAYSGEEIFPDNYEKVQKQQMIKKVLWSALGVVSVVFVILLIVFVKKQFKRKSIG